MRILLGPRKTPRPLPRLWLGLCWALHLVVCLPGGTTPCMAQPELAWRAVQPQIPAALEVDVQRATSAGLERFSGQHLTVYTDVRDRPDIAELPQVFDAAAAAMAHYFRVNPVELADWHLTACVMLDRERFVRAGLIPTDLPDFLAGYQHGSQIWVYQQPGDYYTRHLVFHEGVHALMTHFLGGTGPAWYTEGIAELVALHRWTNDHLELPYDPRSRDEVPFWGRVRLIRDAEQRRSLEEVFALQPAEFRQVDSYAWAWAACKFLASHPRTRDAFHAMPDRVREAPERLQAWLAEQYHNASVDLQLEWNVYLDEMEYGYDVESMALRDVVGHRSTAAGADIIEVDSRYGWQRSPWQVAAGDRVALTAEGEFQIAHDGQPWPADPNGVTLEYHRGVPLGRLLACVLPANNQFTSTTTPEWIEVGKSASFTTARAGILWFRLNDSPANLADNQGSVRVIMAGASQANR